MRRVLQEAAAGKFGWKPAPAPSGRGCGVACGIDAGTYVALMAEVKVDRERGAVKVERVVCAQDMGVVVNPDGRDDAGRGLHHDGPRLRAHARSCASSGGQILDENFDTYELPRFSWLPADRDGAREERRRSTPQGGGEPAIVPMGGGDRQRGVRRDGRAGHPAADHAGATEAGADLTPAAVNQRVADTG